MNVRRGVDMIRSVAVSGAGLPMLFLIAPGCGATSDPDPVLGQPWHCGLSGDGCLCVGGVKDEGDCRLDYPLECCRFTETPLEDYCVCEAKRLGVCAERAGARWVDTCPPTRFVAPPPESWACYELSAGECQCRPIAGSTGVTECRASGCCALLPNADVSPYVPGRTCSCVDDGGGACPFDGAYFAIRVESCPPPGPTRLEVPMYPDWSCQTRGERGTCASTPGASTPACPDKPACCELSEDGTRCECDSTRSCPETGVPRCPPS